MKGAGKGRGPGGSQARPLSDDDEGPTLPRPKPTRTARSQFRKPPLKLFTTTLWEYPSQHYGEGMQGDRNYVGATPSWVIWQCLTRWTREGDLVVDPMCGSGTTIDVARDLKRRVLGYDLSPRREDIFRADARKLPLEDAKTDFVFIDPPYSTHVDYSDDARCIGKLDALAAGDGAAGENEYFRAMRAVIGEAWRVLKPGGHAAVYVSDSLRPAAKGGGRFAAIGFRLFGMMSELMEPVEIVAVVRRNAKLEKGNWRRAAEEGGFMMRGFNYLLVTRKTPQRGVEASEARPRETPTRKAPPRG